MYRRERLECVACGRDIDVTEVAASSEGGDAVCSSCAAKLRLREMQMRRGADARKMPFPRQRKERTKL